MYSGIVYGHLYINCMDGRLFMETGKGLMNEAVYVLSGYEWIIVRPGFGHIVWVSSSFYV